MLDHGDLGASSESLEPLTVRLTVFLEKVLYEDGNILESLGKPRHSYFDAAEAVEKILAKSAVEHFRPKVAIGRRNNSHVDRFSFRRSYTLDFAVLNHAQKLRLHGEGCFANFIQEDSAAIRIFEKAGARFARACEGPAYVAKQLALKQRVHERGAVANREALPRNRAELVKSACDQFLAAPGGSRDQYIRVMTGNFFGELENIKHGWTSANDPLEMEIFEEFGFEVADFRALRENVREFVERSFEPRKIDRLAEVIVSAAFDGIDGGIH